MVSYLWLAKTNHMSAADFLCGAKQGPLVSLD